MPWMLALSETRIETRIEWLAAPEAWVIAIVIVVRVAILDTTSQRRLQWVAIAIPIGVNKNTCER